ncbi:MAG TPA: hypothetical protein VHH73_18945 [Verrucomicrobiae bacterium]|nr:hypothetical protein [Verrucomicrobiae bacterium]
MRSDLGTRQLLRQRFGAASVSILALTAMLVSERWVGGFTLAGLMRMIPFTEVVPMLLLCGGLTRSGYLLFTERQEGTLPLLLLTRLTGRDIVIGKLLAALLAELYCILGMMPVIVVLLAAGGIRPAEFALVALGWANAMFFAVSLGLLGAVLGDSRNVSAVVIVLLLPVFAFSLPFVRSIPATPLWQFLAAFQWLNPGQALAHAQSAASGFRVGAYWKALLINHLVSWAILLLAGTLLPWAVRREAGRSPGGLRRWWQARRARAGQGSFAWRTRLLNRNAYLWRASRDRARALIVGLGLMVVTGAFGYLIFVTRAMPGLATMFFMAMAAGWHMVLLINFGGDAGSALVEDRLAGVLEMILCTPHGVSDIVRGQWMALRRRYLPLVLLVMAGDMAIMIAGHRTHGFGGMIEPEDLPIWVTLWLVNIVLLSAVLAAMAWVAMYYSLSARFPGAAGGAAFGAILALPGFTIWLAGIGLWTAGWRPEWPMMTAFITLSYLGLITLLAMRARRFVLLNLRSAVASRHFVPPAGKPVKAKVREWLRFILFGRMIEGA